MTASQAFNELFPAPFEGLDYKTARGLANEAKRVTQHDDEVTEALLWELRNMPECQRCGAGLSDLYPRGGHDDDCPGRLRVVK